ncbi:MAG: hypothetical protein Q4F67_16225, partial [Propionibacteriaceae bacterium]|nr:hypothetical protein [Propionibacteriaceae bacterium]
MHDAAGGGGDAIHGEAEGDVGDLAHRRERQPLLQIGLAERAERPPQDGERRPDQQRVEDSELAGRTDAEDVVDEADQAECARLDDRDRMQQRAHRRGGDHRRRQPAVQRHERG